MFMMPLANRPLRGHEHTLVGDQVIIHAGSAEYVYEVRSVKQVSAEDVNAMMQHEDRRGSRW